MTESSLEVVRIDGSVAPNLTVTPSQIQYTSVTGDPNTIELEECARNWMRLKREQADEFILVPGASRSDADKWDARCVGTRNGCGPYWVQFMNDRNTRFEFATWEALMEHLVGPLARHGWHTFDTE